MDQENRVVVLIDMDCFYCQVEEKLNPELKGKPIAVVQYNPWKGGGIIAVNYVARAMGVTRHMRGDEAKEKCPEIELPSVPCQRGKADITKYRDAGKEVALVLQKFTPLLERASIDEAYLDITAPVQKRLESLNIHTLTSDAMPNTFALGYNTIHEFISEVHNCGSDSIDFDYDHAKRLLVGALIVSEIRAAVYEQTGYRCSAGIAHNKILAKLVCGMNKPNKQTVLPKHSINILYKTLSLKKVKHLGGKFGDNVCDALRIKTMAELQHFSERELQAKFDEKNGSWLYNIARGVDLEPVQARFNPKSIGCCKQFRGKAALLDLDSLQKWLKDLGDEIDDRLEKDALENNRTPKQMVVSFSVQSLDGRDSSSSRSYNFSNDDELCAELFSSKAMELLMDSTEGSKPKDGESNRKLKAPIKFLGISVGKFEDNESKKTKKINDYFAAGTSKERTPKINENNAREVKNYHKSNNYILQKFLTDSKDTNQKNIKDEYAEGSNDDKRVVMESPLDKQESFFARFLNGSLNPGINRIQQKTDNDAVKLTSEINRSQTPVCNIIPCGDDSNDTDYSGSTINEEINKSIALFDEDQEDISRISNMRQLLSKSNEKSENNSEDAKAEPEMHSNSVSPVVHPKVQRITTVDCECGKAIPLNKLDEHADYHLALKLREEERQEVRKAKERIDKEVVSKDLKKKKSVSEATISKTETVSSITNFLTKIDDGVPTKVCPECGKKVVVEKFSEHQDFHEAQKLSRQLNNKPSIFNLSSNSVKRKKKSASPTRKPKVPCKSIDLFFR